MIATPATDRCRLPRVRNAAVAVVWCLLSGVATTQDDLGPTEPAAGIDLDAPADGLPVTRFEAELEFNRLLAEQRADEALPIGRRMLELTIAEFGARSVEAGRALAALGAAEREAGDIEAAEDSYLRAVEIMRAAGGTYSPALIEPLVGLVDTYEADDDHLNAVSAYNEARNVNRRVYGLLNEDQIPILDRMTESFYSLNQYQEADAQQLAALRLIERNYEPQAPETLDAMYKYGDWLRRSNRFQEERNLYQRAIDTIRDHYGDGDVRLVEPLRRIGNSYREQRTPHGQGISALNDALEILRAQPDPDPLAMAETLLDVGDWHTAFSRVGPEHAEYRRAWELLGRVDGGDALREQWFGGVNYVLREPYSSRGLSTDPDAVDGSVIVRMDLDTSGRSENVSIVASEPAGFKDEAFARQVSQSRFRPHLREGVVVPARGLGVQFRFRYLPEDADG